MKKLLLFGLLLSLSACSPPIPYTVEHEVPKADPVQAAVTAYLKKTLDDPASYQSAEWGKPTPWQQKDADALAAQDAAEKAKITYASAKKMVGHLTPTSRRLFNESAADAKHFQQLEDSLLHTTDTTRLGQVITHTYRAKNKMGALQLDSAQFIVYKNGTVKPL
jgi:hypothetical protein